MSYTHTLGSYTHTLGATPPGLKAAPPAPPRAAGTLTAEQEALVQSAIAATGRVLTVAEAAAVTAARRALPSPLVTAADNARSLALFRASLLSPDSVGADICMKLAQAGALVMADGRRAVIGSPEMVACQRKAKAALESGATREQAAATAQQAALTGDSNKYLLYGALGAAVLIGGALYFSK